MLLTGYFFPLYNVFRDKSVYFATERSDPVKKYNCLLALLVSVFLLLCACAQQPSSQASSDPDALSSAPSINVTPASRIPDSRAPATSAPATSVPAASAPATSAPATSVPATTAPAPPIRLSTDWVVENREIIPFEDRFKEDVPFGIYDSSWLVHISGNDYRKYSLSKRKGAYSLAVMQGEKVIYETMCDRVLDDYYLITADGRWAYLSNDAQIIRVNLLTGESTSPAQFSNDLLGSYIWAGGKDTVCIYTLDQNYHLRYYYRDLHSDAEKIIYEGTIPATPLRQITLYRPGTTQGSGRLEMINPAFYEASTQLGLGDDQIQNELNIPYWVRYYYDFHTGTVTEDFGIIDSCYTGTDQGHDHFDYEITKEESPEILNVEPVEIPNLIKLTEAQAETALNEACTHWSNYDYMHSDFGHYLPYLKQDDVFTKLADIPVTQMLVTADYVYCITAEGTIVQLTKDGQICNSIYTSDNKLDSLCYCQGCLYFTDGSTIVCIDTVAGTWRPIIRTTLKELYVYGEYMGALEFSIRQGLYYQQYLFYPDTGKLEEEPYLA